MFPIIRKNDHFEDMKCFIFSRSRCFQAVRPLLKGVFRWGLSNGGQAITDHNQDIRRTVSPRMPWTQLKGLLQVFIEGNIWIVIKSEFKVLNYVKYLIPVVPVSLLCLSLTDSILSEFTGWQVKTFMILKTVKQHLSSDGIVNPLKLHQVLPDGKSVTVDR